ncbi:MAG TPA: histidine kinase dimerization/phospho-acceptor domain-containing protein [Candidatus Acidoferrum sp.]|nr:histidine kinase dimerization/phospho-acceptor domain-containing protein [Candidatus Acidoferrum sp.]
MSLFPRKQSVCLLIAVASAALQAIGSLALKEGYAATIVSDTVPLVFSFVLIFLCLRNSRSTSSHGRMFWYLNAAAFVFLLLSNLYWLYYEVIRRVPAPTPLFADGCFFLIPALMLAALAFRPHSESAASDLRFRRLDFAFLLSWWLCFYLYFAAPWLIAVHDLASYNPANLYLVLAEQFGVVVALIVLWRKTTGAWRKFYRHACLAFAVFAIANFVQGHAISIGKYYSGDIHDLPIAFGELWLVYAFVIASDLQPATESPLEDPERQGLWSARLGMLAMISLPIIAAYGYLENTAPGAVVAFRLRLILGAMLFLGSLCFLRLYSLDRELQRLVSITEFSYESLKSLQERIAHAQKLAALGRLASGAAHEINNPLTAIFGYSGLLADNPSLSPEERRLAHEIQDQVRLAQTAISSMRAFVSSPAADSSTPSFVPPPR